jgi:hypothetical protein
MLMGDHRSDRDRDRGGRRRPRSRRGDGLIGRGRKVVYRYKIRYKIFIFQIESGNTIIKVNVHTNLKHL